MFSTLKKISSNKYIIEWFDNDGCGQVIVEWKDGRWIIDSECLGFETLIKIIKSIE